jgi:hypothetical protein
MNYSTTPHSSVQLNQRDAFLFSLLRINGPYRFRAFLAPLQEALHERRLVQVYSVHVMSVGCTRIGVENNMQTICQVSLLQRILKMSK